MKPPRRPWLQAPLLLGLTLLLGARSASARPPACPLASVGEALHAGESVELCWSGMPHDALEMEILLSLDGGRSYPVRVSPELDARERRFVWRVPNLPTSGARLRIRIGNQSRETETEPSAMFRIIGRSGEPLELERFHEGAWWCGLDEQPAPAASSLSPPGARLLANGATRSAAPPRAPLALAATRAAERIGPAPASTPSPPSPCVRLAPEFIPPRK